jgi:hypothetical protein
MSEFAGVFGFGSADAVVRVLALAIPAALLLTLIVVLGVKARAKRKTARAPMQALGSAPEVHAAAPAAEPSPAFSAAPVVPPAATGSPIEGVKKQLEQAHTVGPTTALAPLYLEAARLHLASGDEAAYRSALRSAAGFAAQHGPKSAHAAARMGLAELAYKSGDLHGACEQWQIARTVLLDDGQKDAHASIDKLMRDHGCPTDWVLTDF